MSHILTYSWIEVTLTKGTRRLFFMFHARKVCHTLLFQLKHATTWRVGYCQKFNLRKALRSLRRMCYLPSHESNRTKLLRFDQKYPFGGLRVTSDCRNRNKVKEDLETLASEKKLLVHSSIKVLFSSFLLEISWFSAMPISYVSGYIDTLGKPIKKKNNDNKKQYKKL